MTRLIPGPNNELVEERIPKPVSYPAISASYAETASFSLGFMLSASYARFAATASYVIGNISNAVSSSWSVFSGHAKTADTASYALHAYYADSAESTFTSLSSSYSETASFISNTNNVSVKHAQTASHVIANEVIVTSIFITSQITSSVINKVVNNVSMSTVIDAFPDTIGNSAKWLISINDGTSFKTSEMTSIWDPVSDLSNFTETTTNTIGQTIPVAFSTNISSDAVRLIANPASGSWRIKIFRYTI